MDIFRVFQIEAAHSLPNVPAGHKCARLHGHSFRIEIHVTGEPGEHSAIEGLKHLEGLVNLKRLKLTQAPNVAA